MRVSHCHTKELIPIESRFSMSLASNTKCMDFVVVHELLRNLLLGPSALRYNWSEFLREDTLLDCSDRISSLSCTFAECLC